MLSYENSQMECSYEQGNVTAYLEAFWAQQVPFLKSVFVEALTQVSKPPTLCTVNPEPHIFLQNLLHQSSLSEIGISMYSELIIKWLFISTK